MEEDLKILNVEYLSNHWSYEQYGLYCIEIQYQQPELYWYWSICPILAIPEKNQTKSYDNEKFKHFQTILIIFDK